MHGINSPTSLTNELARERNREAADRTLLAWIRTSLAMISLGFGIERLGQAALAFDGRMVGFSPLKTRLFGAALIALGVAATLAGMWEHKRVLATISGEDYRYADRPLHGDRACHRGARCPRDDAGLLFVTGGRRRPPGFLIGVRSRLRGRGFFPRHLPGFNRFLCRLRRFHRLGRLRLEPL